MTTLEIILLGILIVATAIALGYLVRRWNREAYQQGAFEMQQKMEAVLEDAPQSNTSRATICQSDIGSIIEKYDLVFDADLVSYFATGVAAAAWPVILEDIQQAILEKESQIPQGVNTIIVRSYKVRRDGTGEYKLEAMVTMRSVPAS